MRAPEARNFILDRVVRTLIVAVSGCNGLVNPHPRTGMAGMPGTQSREAQRAVTVPTLPLDAHFRKWLLSKLSTGMFGATHARQDRPRSPAPGLAGAAQREEPRPPDPRLLRRVAACRGRPARRHHDAAHRRRHRRRALRVLDHSALR